MGQKINGRQKNVFAFFLSIVPSNFFHAEWILSGFWDMFVDKRSLICFPLLFATNVVDSISGRTLLERDRSTGELRPIETKLNQAARCENNVLLLGLIIDKHITSSLSMGDYSLCSICFRVFSPVQRFVSAMTTRLWSILADFLPS